MTCNLTKARKVLNLVTGIQSNGRCFCILDMNNNRDFSDDYCYRFRLSEDEIIDEFSKQPLVYDTGNGKKAALWIAPLFEWKDGTERDDISNLQCWINYGYTYECDINIGGKDYHIDIYPFGSKHYQYKINKTQKESKYVGTPARIGNVCLNGDRHRRITAGMHHKYKDNQRNGRPAYGTYRRIQGSRFRM